MYQSIALARPVALRSDGVEAETSMVAAGCRDKKSFCSGEQNPTRGTVASIVLKDANPHQEHYLDYSVNHVDHTQRSVESWEEQHAIR